MRVRSRSVSERESPVCIQPLCYRNKETAYTLTIGDDFCIDQDPDVIDQKIADTRSPNTKQAYEKDLRDFFLFISGRLPDQELVLEFLHLEQRQVKSYF